MEYQLWIDRSTHVVRRVEKVCDKAGDGKPLEREERQEAQDMLRFPSRPRASQGGGSDQAQGNLESLVNGLAVLVQDVHVLRERRKPDGKRDGMILRIWGQNWEGIRSKPKEGPFGEVLGWVTEEAGVKRYEAAAMAMTSIIARGAHACRFNVERQVGKLDTAAKLMEQKGEWGPLDVGQLRGWKREMMFLKNQCKFQEMSQRGTWRTKQAVAEGGQSERRAAVMRKEVEERGLRLQTEERPSEGGDGNTGEREGGPTQQETRKENDETGMPGEDLVALGKKWNSRLR